MPSKTSDGDPNGETPGGELGFRWSKSPDPGPWWRTVTRRGATLPAASGEVEQPRQLELTLGEGVARAVSDPPRSPGRSQLKSPPEVPVPLGIREEGRDWFTELQSLEARVGCHSHRGPPWIWQDKGNEDFAFAVDSRDADGQLWVIAGVCDGVTQSPWSERGSRHAAASFIEVVTRRLKGSGTLEADLQAPEQRREFAGEFHECLLRRLDVDGSELQGKRFIDPKFGVQHFEKVFLDSSEGAKRADWFQTTILASALGPRGGFALLMGDGYLRVDRTRGDGSIQRKNVPLQSDPSKPERFASTQLTSDEVLAGFRGVPAEDALDIRVVLATDGVAKSPDHELDHTVLDSREECRRFLQALAGRNDPKLVESDNMSVAFAWRRIHPS